jgi:hypothetical protein
MKHIRYLQFFGFLLISSLLIGCTERRSDNPGDHAIKSWPENPHYWQFKGQPVLLLGATDNDNLFQNNNIESHLDSMKAIGGNYIRNTMSDRDPGDQRAFAMTPDGKYDLNQWNDEYWRRFENMLMLTAERDIIVQIEIWDRFDHSGERWLTDPYNPKNNINYTYSEAALDSLYPNPSNLAQHFFLTIPALKYNEILLNIQKAFVKKMLSISLKYDHVLYCIDNETTGPEEWGIFWAEFLKENAQGKDIYITQMWNNWNLRTDMHKWTLDHPERYGYIDISQNSHNVGYMNWSNAQYVFDYIKDNPRPVNSTKIYGVDGYDWLNTGMSSAVAVQNFFRNIVGGFASSRFHRPPHGLGFSQHTIQAIKTVRKIEEHVKMWDIAPRMDLLGDSEENLAYMAAKAGEKYVVYFTKRGRVNLDLSGHDHEFTIRWINTNTAEWAKSEEIKGGSRIELEAVNENGSFAVLTRNDQRTTRN